MFCNISVCAILKAIHVLVAIFTDLTVGVSFKYILLFLFVKGGGGVLVENFE